MDVAIPLQRFEPQHVNLGHFVKSDKLLLATSYKDTNYSFTNVSILLPILRVASYQPATGKLILDMKEWPHLLQKLRTLQEGIVRAVYAQQSAWFPGTRSFTLEEIDSQFQKIVNQSVLILFCPASENGGGGKPIIPCFHGGAWQKTLLAEHLRIGSHVRVALKLSGLSFQLDSNQMWTGRFRLQHKIQAVYCSE